MGHLISGHRKFCSLCFRALKGCVSKKSLSYLVSVASFIITIMMVRRFFKPFPSSQPVQLKSPRTKVQEVLSNPHS